MPNKTVFTVGFKLPEEDFESKSFNSNASLLDADIILFQPKLEYRTDYGELEQFERKPCLSAEGSARCLESVKHWRNELIEASKYEKTIFIFLSACEKIYYRTGERTHYADVYSFFDSYELLPFDFKSKKKAEGKNIKFAKGGNFLKSYWNIVKNMSNFELYFEIEGATPIFQTKYGDNVTSAFFKEKNGGNFILVPPLSLPNNFTEFSPHADEEVWTAEGKKFSKILLSQIIAIDKTLRLGKEHTPPPEWANEEEFELDIESKKLAEIKNLEKELEKIKDKISDKKLTLEKYQIPKGLLYENGKQLEYAIIDALEIIGFKAEHFNDGESEFDVVFESKEGRFIGEAEGKDNSAINIHKHQQLERNIGEDYAKESTKDCAKGILFGNPHRLIHPQQRKESFTTKVIASAKRTGTALVNTYELFGIVKYLISSKDEMYAKKVRECFKDVSGEIIKFPDIPKI